MSVPFSAILIANRGEIAIRIANACADLGIRSVGVFAEDDQASLHTRQVDEAVALPGRGVPAYLKGAQLIAIAREQGCEAIHPGYGFLAENADFAEQCSQAGLALIGPGAQTLRLFGDKAAARALAAKCQVPLVQGTAQAVSLEEAKAFMASLDGSGVMIKALSGGGGRGMRAVTDPNDLEAAYQRCQSEAKAAFGNAAVYVEQLITAARHVEVQVLGDGSGAVSHLWERDCTLQRRHQKLVEFAPAPGLDPALRDRIIHSALTLAAEVHYLGIGTFEFLVEPEQGRFYFMEANPRVQVEHTVTEQVTGVDLVQSQICLAAGASLADLQLDTPPVCDGMAVQLRLNMETLKADGSTAPSAGTLTAYEPASGPGIRVDGYGYAGYAVSPAYDSLLAKLIVTGADYGAVLQRARRALKQTRIAGVQSNLPLLQALLTSDAVQANAVTTRYVESHLAELLAALPEVSAELPAAGSAQTMETVAIPTGCDALLSPTTGVLVSVLVNEGATVQAGQVVAVLEAMKMEFEIRATMAGRVHSLAAEEGDALNEAAPLLFVEPGEVDGPAIATEESVDLDHIRKDLAEVLDRHHAISDEGRPKAVEKRHRKGKRTARENLDDLLDTGSFQEYGAMALAAQRRRRSAEELQAMSPADGLIGGTGTVNADQVGEQAGRVMAMSYDYTVFAGTQGVMNHKKTDRLLQLAGQWKMPLVLFAEGGGGRPGDTDFVGVGGLDCPTFAAMAKLSGEVPLVGIGSGRCFAGNAALLGCCDVIIATKDSTIGMAGPAMIEGGGLGRYTPEQVGPVDMHTATGVVDIAVDDEADAVAVAKQYLSYFQGTVEDWQVADQRELRHKIPEKRTRVYDIRNVIETLADSGSVLELRRGFSPGMITALIRIEGKPFGLIANDPTYLGGAIDAVGGDKAARFMQLCEAFGLPMVSLCDTPGFMVGPEAEKQGTVRHVSRMFVAAASLTVPFLTIVLRKGYGLGAQAMAAGSFHSPLFIAAWPSGEFGAMGLEGAVRLGFAKELAAQPTPERQERLFNKLVSKAYQQGKALNMASFLEIDAVIDPVDTRQWILRGLNASGFKTGTHGGRPFVDTF
ncbi:carbamoyl-phosphate synthase large subunit [Alcanivorax sp. HI0083]|nr:MULTISPECIES: carboxyl transferase domain-containing protein [unclassified Alcanivorax]KZY29054.1 carbamoyl-phosphate synthase large subunit [Alcanivorax sp. HI0044]KZZ26954.1 carbamoyl-phosphate synthase large subunit [Alcanivorax sp. HI0083]